VILFGYEERPPAAPERLAWQRLPRMRAGKASAWLSHQWVLPNVARKLAVDVLHIPGINVRLSRPGVPFRSPCPLVVTMHDVIPLTYYGRQASPLPWRLRLGFRLGLLATRRAGRIITVSETARKDLLRHLALRPERVVAVLNGLDRCWHDAAEGASPRGEPYLLYAGSYEQRKNLLGTAEAYRRALSERDLPPLVLLVERESGHKDAVMAAVRKLGVIDHLRFVHSLSDEELVRLYRGASMFLFPSFYEGFGFPPLQALAARVPVIASRTSSLPEVLGDAACYVDPTSPAELAEAIIRLHDDRCYARDLAARGPRQAAGFTWNAAARQTLAAYQQAVGRV
jgi:glycosyltransferase involved in cell wall biosynthesis